MTRDQLRALRLGEVLVDERGTEWIVACLLMAGHVGVRQGDWRYRLVGEHSTFQPKMRGGDGD